MAPLSGLAWLFIALLCAKVALTLWLSRAQSLTVARHRDQVPKAFAEVLNVSAHHRAADYTRAKETALRKVVLWDGCILLAWTLGGGLTAVDQAAHRWLGNGQAYPFGDTSVIAHGVVMLLMFAGINWALDLPASLWRTFVIEQRFGFNRTTWRLFALDQLKGAVLSAAIGLPLWALMLACLQDPSPFAWVVAWAGYGALTLLLVWAGPRLIAPLFNTFKPLDDGPTKQRIEALLHRCGYGQGGVFVMDGSARSSHGNAYFTGLGQSKRVVFFDTLLQTLNDDEIEGVLAHELGHYALGHIQKQLVVSTVMSAGVFCAAAWALQAEGLYQSLGVVAASLPAKLLVLSMVASLLSFGLTPIFALISRRREYEADAYACKHAEGQALGRALVKLFVDNGATLTPHPLHATFYNSHPPAVARLRALHRQVSARG